MRRYGTVQDWRDTQKGTEFAGWSTAGELAALLGITRKYLSQLVQRGGLPAHDGRCPNGWRVWSPATVQKALEMQKSRKGLS